MPADPPVPPEDPGANGEAQPAVPDPPARTEPAADWEHVELFGRVKDALLTLPTYFDVETSITGIPATEIHNLNTFLGATIEDQVVGTLNAMRQVWDPDKKYSTYSFVRQAQTFPDVLLRREQHAGGADDVLLGIELKGWYPLAKEAVPTFRFQVTPAACAPQDLIVVVPWALSQVISGHPKVFRPYIESARYAADYRNYWWQHVRESEHKDIESPAGVGPYPAKSDQIQDRVHDPGGNFGRLARTGMLEDYIADTKKQLLCGIAIEHWLIFFKSFVETRQVDDVRKALERLADKIKKKAGDEPDDTMTAALAIVAGLEKILFPE